METHRRGRPERNEHQPAQDTQAQLTGIIDQGVQSLLSELQQGTSDRLHQYLAFAGRFHRYSPQNQLLIYSQKPDATRVAGYKTWEKLGYHVAKGEKAIRIWAPRPYTATVTETIKEEKDEAQQERTVTGTRFVAVPVFDASQLANLQDKPLPEFWTSLEDDQQELTTRLEDVVRSEGIRIATSERTGTAQGYSAGREIVLKAGLDSRRRFLTLTHV